MTTPSGRAPLPQGSRRTDPADLADDDLRQRLDSLPLIEQSKGLLMGYHGISADEAFELLRQWSSVRNAKVRDLSTELVQAAGRPSPRPYGALEDHLRLHGLV